MAGKIDPRDIHQQCVPCIPFGVPGYVKKFNRCKESYRTADAAIYLGFDEESRTHIMYYEQVKGYKRNFMQHTPHVTFDLTLPVPIENHTTVVVGTDSGEVQPKINDRTDKYADMGGASDTYEVETQVIDESTLLKLAQPEANVDETAETELPLQETPQEMAQNEENVVQTEENENEESLVVTLNMHAEEPDGDVEELEEQQQEPTQKELTTFFSFPACMDCCFIDL